MGKKTEKGKKPAAQTGYEPREVEARWYARWEEQGLFRAPVASEKPAYSIVIPPPNVTGSLHMGHALNNTLQDILIRYKRMDGYATLWMPGMDHAGIATQTVVERMLAKEEKVRREDLGREEFIRRIWQWKEKYGGIIIEQLKRLGCSCDWSRTRFTMDEGLSRAVREVFVELYRESLIYRGQRMINWCPRCHTALSDLEVEHAEKAGKLWYLRYPFEDGSGSVVVATTRPETMLGDTAVAVNPEDDRFRELIGRTIVLPVLGRRIPLIADARVAKEFGTGAVKTTPAHDFVDFEIGKDHGLPFIQVIDERARMTSEAGPFAGLTREECREKIVADFEATGILVKTEPYALSVGECQRCRTILEPMVSLQWFVKMKPLAEPAIAAVREKRTRIIPELWEKTYFEWMENIRDWCISRQIWWGHRIPAYSCPSCGKQAGSEEGDPERKLAATEPIEKCPYCGSAGLNQAEDVLDTWFSSGLWPFSTLGWPDRTPELETYYPTSVLITGFDILFFWVARMMMMGLKFMGEVPFRDVHIHALVRDAEGQKMSKTRGNVVDPLDVIARHGADAFRFTLAAFAAQGRDVRLAEERIQGYRHFCNKIWNAARFALMNLEGFDPEASAIDREKLSVPERWILSRLERTAAEVRSALDSYKFNEAASAVYSFFWHELCDWYVELAKPHLGANEPDPTRRAAVQACLLHALKGAIRLLHPFMPFLTEEIWQKLPGAKGSIMVAPFPKDEGIWHDAAAEEEMVAFIEVATKIRNLKAELGIAPGDPIEAWILTKDEASAARWRECEGWLASLIRFSRLTIAAGGERPKQAATGIASGVEVLVSFGTALDVGKNRTALLRDREKIEKDIAFKEGRLGNPSFRDRAPAEVVAQEEKDLEGLRERRIKVDEVLARIAEATEG